MSAAGPPTDLSDLIACHACDLLHEKKPIAYGAAAKCSRCGALLYRRPKDSIERALTLSLTALILFTIANVCPFLYFKLGGRVEVNTVFTGVVRLYDWGMWPLAAVIFAVTILAPGLKIFLMLYIVVPLRFDRTAPKLAQAVLWLGALGPWGMLEVYMLGVLIALGTLTAMASVVLGTAFYAFVVLMFVTTAASAALDPNVVWARLEKAG